MKLEMNAVKVRRGPLVLAADAILSDGLHLIRGPVGSGKSTLALVLAGLLAPAEGSVSRTGIRSCMLSLQFPEYQVTGSTLAGECASWGLDPGPVLSSAGLPDRGGDRPLSLSRGELKRLHLACVLAKEYDLLLLDEPFSALDCGQKEIISRRLSGRRSGITVVFTHEQEILPPVDRCWEIRNGTLAALPGRIPMTAPSPGRGGSGVGGDG